jgi:hypothetical protein
MSNAGVRRRLVIWSLGFDPRLILMVDAWKLRQ